MLLGPLVKRCKLFSAGRAALVIYIHGQSTAPLPFKGGIGNAGPLEFTGLFLLSGIEPAPSTYPQVPSRRAQPCRPPARTYHEPSPSYIGRSALSRRWHCRHFLAWQPSPPLLFTQNREARPKGTIYPCRTSLSALPISHSTYSD